MGIVAKYVAGKIWLPRKSVGNGGLHVKIISIDGSSVSGETDFYSIFLGLTSVMATDTMIYSWVGSTALPLVAKNHSLHLYLIGGFNPSEKIH